MGTRTTRWTLCLVVLVGLLLPPTPVAGQWSQIASIQPVQPVPQPQVPSTPTPKPQATPIAPPAPQLVPPSAPIPTAPNGSRGLGPLVNGKQEVLDRRTRTSRTFRRGDGTFEAHLYPTSIHYPDAQGHWQPIDNTLVPATMPGAGYQNRANRYTVTLPTSLAAPVHLVSGTVTLDLALVGAGGTATISGTTATYANALPGVTVALTAEPDALKETLVLASASAPHTFSYTLHASAGLTPQPKANGRINFVNAAGQFQFALAAPFMVESSGGAGLSHAVTQAISPSAGGWTVTVTADSAWLADPARQWPVVLDPTVTFTRDDTVTFDGTDQECYLWSGTSANTNFCGDTRLKLGYNGTDKVRTLLQFNVAGDVPANQQVLNVELGLYLVSSTTSTGAAVDVHALSRNWTTNVTWNKYDGTNAWTTAGGDFNTTPTATATGVGASLGWSTWYPKPDLIQSWANGTVTNNGFLLKQSSETVTNVLSFAPSTYSDSSKVPYLQVIYGPWVGERPFYPLLRQRLNDRTQLSVNLATGNLGVRQDELGLAGIGQDLTLSHWYNNQLFSTPDQAYTSDTGYKWTLNAGRDVRLIPFADGSVAFNAPSGFATPFVKNSDGSFTSPAGSNAKLVQHGDGTSTLTFNRTGLKYQFSSAGQLTAAVDQNGNPLRYGYNGSGAVTRITDTLGVAVTVGYNAANVRTTLTDGSGRQWQYTYDANDRLLTATDPAGGVTTYTYDNSANDNLVKIVDPVGNTTVLTYTTSNGLPLVSALTRYTNVAAGQGSTTTFTYNSGNTVVTDPNGNPTTYFYDAFGRVTRVVDALTGQTTFTYNANHEFITRTDPLSHTTTLAYDASNNPTSVQIPTGATWTLAYTNTTFPFYPTSITNPFTQTWSLGYSSTGNIASFTVPGGAQSLFGYDATGRVTTSTNALNFSQTVGYGTGTARPITATNELGQVVTYSYDSIGRRISMTDPLGRTTRYGYDVLDRLTVVTDALGVATTYTYDKNGNLTSVTDGNTHTSTYAYDALNRQISQTDPLSNITRFGYDAIGNRTLVTLPTGVVNRLVYDQLNRLTGQDLQNNGSLDIQYGYDAASRRTLMTDTTGTTTYTYDNANRITSVSAPTTGTVGYQYDAAGRRTQVTYPSTHQVTYGYTARNELATVTDWQSRVLTYTYDLAGRLAGITRTNGVNTTMTYDNAGRMTGIGHATGVTALERITYTINAVGNRTVMTDSAGVTTWGYDPLDRLTSATYPGGSSEGFGYDRVGNRTVYTTNGTLTTSYVYDNANRLSSSTASGTTTTYGSDATGNLTTKTTSGTTTTYSWDSLNRLTGISGPITASYSYNGDGLRVSKTSGTTSNYTWDPIGLGAIIGESGGTEYVRGLGLIEQLSSTGAPTYVHTDALGSVRLLTDNTGASVGTQQYTAFGTTRVQTGGQVPFTFTGEQSDSESGLFYLRARHYDPNLGRFLSKDPYSGDLTEPCSQHRYTYVRNNPINSTDPSGNVPCGFLPGYGALAGGASSGIQLYNLYTGIPSPAVSPMQYLPPAITFGASFGVLIYCNEAPYFYPYSNPAYYAYGYGPVGVYYQPSTFYSGSLVEGPGVTFPGYYYSINSLPPGAYYYPSYGLYGYYGY